VGQGGAERKAVGERIGQAEAIRQPATQLVRPGVSCKRFLVECSRGSWATVDANLSSASKPGSVRGCGSASETLHMIATPCSSIIPAKTQYMAVMGDHPL